MIDTIIISGGNIQNGFALDFLKKNEACLIAADKGLEFFLEHQLLPDAVIGDFDILLPPLEEQKRIVCTVNKVFTKLDTIMESL